MGFHRQRPYNIQSEEATVYSTSSYTSTLQLLVPVQSPSGRAQIIVMGRSCLQKGPWATQSLLVAGRGSVNSSRRAACTYIHTFHVPASPRRGGGTASINGTSEPRRHMHTTNRHDEHLLHDGGPDVRGGSQAEGAYPTLSTAPASNGDAYSIVY